VIRKTLSAVLIGAIVVLPMPARAQLVVVDPTNLVENALQAAYALEQINNQIRSLQNEATMLENWAKDLTNLDLSKLDAMLGDLGTISALIDQAQGIAFDVDATKAAFEKLYPGHYDEATTTDQLLADAQSRWQDAMAGFQTALTVQAGIAKNVEADADTLSALVTASQEAEGNLQAQQAANQLIALSTKQQMQIQSLMAAQFRAEALDQARKAEAEEEARAALTRFLGDGKAYNE
jgi:P-type conjugative transfer protein TrbJ